MEIKEFIKFAVEIMEEHKLYAWTVEIDRAVRRAGICNHTYRKLGFSKHFIENNTESHILDTLLHEIAHALVGAGVGHGSVWQRKCKEIGLTDPTRCTGPGVVMPKGKYQAKCPSCGPIEAYRHRLTARSATLKHTACKSLVKWEQLS